MNPGESLQLRDIHLPADLAWWPLAPGWWVLLGLLIAITLSVIFIYRYWQGRKLLRAASLELNRIKTSYTQQADDRLLVQEVSIWLRRVCLSCYPRAEVAGLTGESWLAFLDQQLARDKHAQRFNSDTGQVLIRGPYQQATRVNADGLLALCQHWLKYLPRNRKRPL